MRVDKFIEVMIDTETMSLQSNAAVVSLAAVTMDFGKGTLGDEFKGNATPGSNMRAGLHFDQKTIDWWKTQSAEAKMGWMRDPEALHSMLWRFNDWLRSRKNEPTDRIRVWSMGAAFDIPIVQNALRACELPVLWSYKDVMCHRTMYALNRDVKATYYGTSHDALDDAKNQARHLIQIMQYVNRPWWKRVF